MRDTFPKRDEIEILPYLVAPEEKEDYYKIFDSLDPENGLLSEAKVRFVLMGLTFEVFSMDKIWSLSDQDGDGCLDRYEWTVAVHLTLGALEGDQVIHHRYHHLINNTQH